MNSWVWEVKLALQRLALIVGFVCLLSQGSSNASKNSDVAQNFQSTSAIEKENSSMPVTINSIPFLVQISYLTTFLTFEGCIQNLPSSSNKLTCPTSLWETPDPPQVKLGRQLVEASITFPEGQFVQN